MLTVQKLEEIDARLREGVTPDEIAAGMGLTYHQLRTQLLNSGKRITQIVTLRRLEDTAPVQDEELALAG